MIGKQEHIIEEIYKKTKYSLETIFGNLSSEDIKNYLTKKKNFERFLRNFSELRLMYGEKEKPFNELVKDMLFNKILADRIYYEKDHPKKNESYLNKLNNDPVIKKFEAFKHVPKDLLDHIGKDGKIDIKLDFTEDDIKKLENKGFDLINPKLMTCTEGEYSISAIKVIVLNQKIYKYVFVIKKDGEKKKTLKSLSLSVPMDKKINYSRAFEKIFDDIYIILKKHKVNFEKEEDVVRGHLDRKNSIMKVDPYDEEDWGTDFLNID